MIIWLNKHKVLIFITAGCIFLIIHGWSLLRYPAPMVDEATLISRAWTFISTGHQYGELDSGLADSLPGVWTINSWFFTFFQSLALRLFSRPSLLAGRVLSLLWGIVLLFATYKIAKKLGNKQIAWICTILVSFSNHFILSAHQARYDIAAATIGYGAIALILDNTNHRNLKAFFAGLILLIACEIHLNSIIFLPILLLIFFIESSWKMFVRKYFWLFIIGCLTGLFIYSFLHFAQYPSEFLQINNAINSEYYTPPILRWDIMYLLNRAVYTLIYFLLELDISIVLIIGSTIYLLLHPILNSRTVLWINLVMLIVVILIYPTLYSPYGIIFTPAYLLIPSFVISSSINKQLQPGFWPILKKTGLWILVGLSFLSSYRLFIDDHWLELQNANALVKKEYTSSSVVMGSQLYWFDFSGKRFYSWEFLPYYRRFHPGASIEDALNNFKPDMIVIDYPTYLHILDEEKHGYPRLQYPNFRQEMFDTLISKSTKYDVVSTKYYGPIFIFHFDWKVQSKDLSHTSIKVQN